MKASVLLPFSQPWCGEELEEAFIWFYATGPASVSSKKQAVAGSSFTIRKYVPPGTATKKFIYLSKLLDQMVHAEANTLLLYTDNKSAYQVLREGGYVTSKKWHDDPYDLIRHCFEKGRSTSN